MKSWKIICDLGLPHRTRIFHYDEANSLRPSHDDWHAILAGQTLPLLENLGLASRTLEDSTSSVQDPPIAPALRNLTMNIPYSIRADHLTSFHSTGSIWHWKLLLQTLRHWPSLVELNMDTVHGDTDEYLSEDTYNAMKRQIREPSVVRLSNFLTLRIKSCGEKALQLLSHLDLPGNMTFVVDQICGLDEVEILQRLLSQPELCHAPCGVLTITDTSKTPGWYPVTSISLADDPPDFSMQSHAFKNGSWLSGMLENNMILDIIDAIPKAVVSSIHTLALNHDATETDCDHGCQGSFSDIPQHYIPQPFRRFSGVTTLHLRRQGNETFPDMLSSSPTGDWLFPALHTLVIIMVEPVERSWSLVV